MEKSEKIHVFSEKIHLNYYFKFYQAAEGIIGKLQPLPFQCMVNATLKNL